MGLSLTFKQLAKALPVILANAPAIIDTVRTIRRAVSKPRKVPPAAAE
jgi:hypothetical protein